MLHIFSLVLVDFFKDMVMSVKWHQTFSSSRNLSGGGLQGATLGLLEYLSQSNKNSNHINPELRFQWMDDLTTLEPPITTHTYHNHP